MRQRASLIAICGILSILSMTSGCMLSPNDGDSVANRSSYVSFKVGTIGEEHVRIQARNVSTGGWVTIGEMDANIGPIPWDGTDWYVGLKSLRIPNSCWDLHFAGHTVDRVYFTAEVRAITDSGAAVTFERGFYDWFRDGDTWTSSGYGNSHSPAEVMDWSTGTSTVTIRTYVMNL